MWIYNESDIRNADDTAERNGLSGNTLMELAGRGLFEKIKQIVPKTNRILILSGRGNNGGDGIVLARYLKQVGYDVELTFPFGESKTDAAKEHFRYYKSLGYTSANKVDDQNYDTIVDALLGVGTRLPLNKSFQALLEWCNKQYALRIAIDLPTGVQADCGDVEVAFKAHYTFSLYGFKPATFLSPSYQYFGKVESIDIGLPHSSNWRIWTREDVNHSLQRRGRDSHKGTFGTGLLVAGTDEMPGSALLAGLGAMKIGIGKLIIGTSSHASGIIATKLPEATFLHGGLQTLTTNSFPSNIKAMAIGPGLTDRDQIEHLLEKVWGFDIPIILDAGALYKRTYKIRKAPVLITPHPGEFSRLTGYSIKEIQANRLHLASTYAKENNLIVVLKGANTVIAYPDGTGFINTTGNAALAKGGSGDTLTGMILGLICSENDIKSAVNNAVYLHGFCADELVRNHNERTIVASDLTSVLGTVLNRLQSQK